MAIENEVAELILAVDSGQVRDATKALDDLATSADSAEKATTGSLNKIEASAKGATTMLGGFADVSRSSASSLHDYAEAVSRSHANDTKSIELNSDLAKRLRETANAHEGAAKKVDEHKDSMERAGPVTEGLKDKLMNLAKTLGPLAVGVAAFNWIKGAITDFVELGDQLNKFSLQTGMTVEQLSGLKFAAEQNDLSLEAMVGSITKLQNVMAKDGKIAEALREVGVSAREPVEAFMQLAEAVKNAKDPLEQARIAQLAYGRGFKEMLPILKEGAAGIGELMDAGVKYNHMTEEQAKQADQFKDSMHEIETAMHGVKLAVGSEFLPALGSITGAMAESMREGEIFKGIMVGIGGVMYETAAAIKGVWDKMAYGLQDIVEGSVELVKTWASDLVDAATSKAKEWVTSGANMANKFIAGMSYRFNAGIEAISKWVSDIAEMAKAKAKDWYSIGANIVQGIIDGIKKKWAEMLVWFKDKVDALPQWVKDILDIKSPSKKFVEIGEEIANGMAKGIADGTPKVSKEAQKMAEKAMKAAQKEAVARAKETAKLIEQATKNSIADATAEFEKEAKVWDEWQKNFDRVKDSIESIADSLEPARVATEKYQKQMDDLTEAVFLNIISMERYLELTDKLATGKPDAKVEKDIAAQTAVVEKEWEKTADNISQSLTDALLRGFESGKDFMKNFVDTLRNLFSTLILRPIIEPIARQAAGGVMNVLGIGGSTGGASGGSSMLSSGFNLLGSLGSMGTMASYGLAAGTGGLLAGATQGGMLAAQTGAFGAFGATSTASALGGVAGSAGGALGGLMSGIGAAMPYIGIALALYSIFGKSKPSNKAAFGSIDLGTGDLFDLGNQTGKKQASQETMDARTGLLNSVGEYYGLLGKLGATQSGSVRVDVGERDGIQFGTNGGKMKSYGKDADAALVKLFKELAASSETLLEPFKTLIVNFEGGAEAMGTFVNSLTLLNDYMNADPLKDVNTIIADAGKTAWQVWKDGESVMRNALSAYDGSIDKTNELAQMTAERYQAEINMLAQIQGYIESLHGAFQDTIMGIQYDMLKSEEERYNWFRAQADIWYGVLEQVTDPTLIAEAAGKVNQYSNSAWGLLDDTQKQQVGQEFIDYLQGADDLTMQKLDEASQAIVDNHQELVDVMAAALNSAADKMGAAADTMVAAANTPVTVAPIDVNVTVDSNPYVGEASSPSFEVGYG